jgi:hypothetical protein
VRRETVGFDGYLHLLAGQLQEQRIDAILAVGDEAKALTFPSGIDKWRSRSLVVSIPQTGALTPLLGGQRRSTLTNKLQGW